MTKKKPIKIFLARFKTLGLFLLFLEWLTTCATGVVCTRIIYSDLI